MTTIDSHQHFWKFDPERDKWMTPGTMDKIRRDFLPGELLNIFQRENIDGSIAVQAAQTIEETEFLLDLAEEHRFIRGVVGWIDLRDPQLPEKLVKYNDADKLVGFRHILQAEENDYMLDPDFITGIRSITSFGYTYDLLIYWHQLDEAIVMVEQLPETKIVIDHLAKPDVRDGRILKWSKGMKALGSMPNVYCKISGVVTEAHWQYWQVDEFGAYLDIVFEEFGPERCMFGSDWPVMTLASTYHDWVQYVRQYIARFNDKEQANIMGQNCLNFYNLE